jgi:hypothetical protein
MSDDRAGGSGTDPGSSPHSSPPPDGPPADADAPDRAERIRRRRVSRRTRRLLKDLHQRTWELELFISGAVTFVLAQLPAQVDAVYFRLDPFLADGAGLGAFMAYYYVKLILYTLVGGFGTHLLTRALWVALVGLDSVFPRGIRWSRLTLGPNMRKVLPETITSVREMIVRADGVASVIFAVSFSLVAVFGLSVVVAVVFGGGAVFLLSLLPVDPAPAPVLLAVVLVGSLLLTLPPLVDRYFGDRLAPESLASRSLRRLLRWMLRLQGMPIYGSIQYTLASQLGSARYGWGVGIFIAGLVSFFLVKDVVVGQGNLAWAPTGAVPVRAGPLGIEPQHYEDYRTRRRSEGRYVEPFLPTIPRETLGADDAWVRLFIPYRPGSDPDRLALLCPELDPLAGAGLRGNRITRGTPADSLLVDDVEALACLASIWQVEVDGIPTEAEPLFLRHPDTGIPGVVRYLDTRGMAPGRHLLTVRRNPDGLEPRDDGEPRRPLQYDISFWR